MSSSAGAVVSLTLCLSILVAASSSDTIADDSAIIFPDTYAATMRAAPSAPPTDHEGGECSSTCVAQLGQCKMPISPTVDFKCYGNKQEQVSCDGKVQPGTVVTFSCKAHHYYAGYKYNMTCLESGCFDNPTPRCRADCGKRVHASLPQRLKRDMDDSHERGTFPWQVALYRNLGNPNKEWTFICGGVLVSNNLVLTSAHCVYDQNRETLFPADNFSVAVGKLYSKWDHPLDDNNYARKSLVKSIHIPAEYKGVNLFYQHNIAILEVAEIFELSDYVRPACLDLSNDAFNKIQMTPGVLGKVAGWGFTEEEGTVSEILESLDVPIIAMDVCRREMAKYNFVRYLTPDNFCAGYTTGSALCKGDSGGGLVVSTKSRDNIERWYLRGLVSTGPISDIGSCRADTYTAYTEIYKQKDFLLKKFFELNVNVD